MANIQDRLRSAAGRNWESNEAGLSQLRAEAHAIIDLLFDSLRDVEQGIDEAREALAVSQPPGNGRLDVRWWSSEGHRDPLLHPILVRWVKKGHVAYPRPVKRLNVRRDGTAAINADQAESLVEIVRTLIGMRHDWLHRFYSLRRLTQHLRHLSLRTENHKASIAMLRERSLTRLTEHGYEICISSRRAA